MRKQTREVKVGNLIIGNNNSIIIQSMCNTKTNDIKSTVAQIKALETAGCELIRVAVPNQEAVTALKEIKQQINIPLVADIHFDYRLAIAATATCDKIRINPGNIGSETKIQQVIEAAKKNNCAIRIGVNSGSLEKNILEKYGFPCADALVESALNHIKFFEQNDFHNIIISVKASDVMTTINANRLLSEKCDYPLHIGVTEAGTLWSGTIKSAIGIGTLLSAGIGDTIRVSLTADPVEEVKVAYEIMKDLPKLNGINNTYFCGSYFGYGLHEDAVTSSINIVDQINKG